MKRASATLLTAVFILIVPTTVVGLVPWLICGWRIAPTPLDPPFLRFAGVPLLACGVVFALDAMRRFAWEGRGTPAPPLPPGILVVTGLYRYVRNPMYVSILLILIGQGLLFASPGLFLYAACAWLATHLFVCFYEEPTLRRTFGAQYTDYCAHVHRWIPRLRPWKRNSAAAQLRTQ
jgi:protein-S-isoprenylcysteine O-methyltransferase Ste14